MSWKNRKNLDGNLEALEKHLRNMEREEKEPKPCPWCKGLDPCDCHDAAADDAWEARDDE